MGDQDLHGFRERFRNATIEQLVEAFNGDVGNPGWIGARGSFHAALKEAFLGTGLDCSSFINRGSMSLACRIRLEGQRLITMPSAPPCRATETESTSRRKWGPEAQQSVQAFIDALIAALIAEDHAGMREVGLDLMDYSNSNNDGISSEWEDGGILVTNESIEEAARQFAETSASPSGERAADILDGSPLTAEELTDFVHTSAERLFENTEEAFWTVLRIRASSGSQAFLVQRVYGSSWEGLDFAFLGMASSIEDARAVAQRFSYLDAADLRTRYPAQLASAQ